MGGRWGGDVYGDGFKKSIRTQHVEKFSIQSGNATPAPPKNLPPPDSISILKMEEDSWGVWAWGYRAGRRKKKLNHDAMLNFSTLRVLMNFLIPSMYCANSPHIFVVLSPPSSNHPCAGRAIWPTDDAARRRYCGGRHSFYDGVYYIFLRRLFSLRRVKRALMFAFGVFFPGI